MPAKINSQLVWAKKGAVRLIYNGKEMECQDNNDRKSKLPKEHHSNYHNIMLIVLSKHSKTMMTKTIKVNKILFKTSNAHTLYQALLIASQL